MATFGQYVSGTRNSVTDTYEAKKGEIVEITQTIDARYPNFFTTGDYDALEKQMLAQIQAQAPTDGTLVYANVSIYGHPTDLTMKQIKTTTIWKADPLPIVAIIIILIAAMVIGGVLTYYLGAHTVDTVSQSVGPIGVLGILLIIGFFGYLVLSSMNVGLSSKGLNVRTRR